MASQTLVSKCSQCLTQWFIFLHCDNFSIYFVLPSPVYKKPFTLTNLKFIFAQKRNAFPLVYLAFCNITMNARFQL